VKQRRVHFPSSILHVRFLTIFLSLRRRPHEGALSFDVRIILETLGTFLVLYSRFASSTDAGYQKIYRRRVEPWTFFSSSFCFSGGPLFLKLSFAWIGVGRRVGEWSFTGAAHLDSFSLCVCFSLGLPRVTNEWTALHYRL